MERDAQRAVRRIQTHQEIVKRYQKVVRAYNNFIQGLMQDNCRFGDMLKDEKRKKVSLNMNWEDLWVSMQYPYLWATST